MTYYLCVLDFEATCTDCAEFHESLMEIIEFPSILYRVDGDKVTYVDTFHRYVKPEIQQKLTKFCTELTGITQDVVDKADIFKIVYKDHIEWINRYVSVDEELIFATCGHWDLSVMLPRELLNKGLKFNHIYNKYVNIKDEFKRFYKMKAGSMKDMMNKLKIPFDGRLHSGIDDTKNMSKVIVKMISDGHSTLSVNRVKKM
jgi:inhibitor of KinA sporulation pathway (predicted exonuclease)